MARVTGWLPYGSSDSSVLLQVPLTSAITASDVPYDSVTLLMGTVGPQHDSTLGMIAKEADGTETAYKLATPDSTITGSNLQWGGQISIEVEAAWLCAQASALTALGTASEGYANSASENLLRIFTTSGGLKEMQIGKGINSAICGITTLTSASPGSTGYDYRDDIFDSGTATGGRYWTQKKDRFVTVNIGWRGREFFFAVDGLIYSGLRSMALDMSAIFDNVYIGAFSATVAMGQDDATGYYVRNFQISDKPPVFDSHRLLQHTYFLGDSTMDNFAPGSGWTDNNIQMSFRKVFNQKGYTTGKVTMDENGGYYVSSAGTQLISKIATLLAAQPKVVCIQGGVNDAANTASFSAAQVESDYQELIAQVMLGTSKNAKTPTDLVILSTNLPRANIADTGLLDPDEGTKVANYAAVRDVIKTLPAWWDTTYGGTYGTGRVVIADVHGKTGGVDVAVDGLANRLTDWLVYDGAGDDGVHPNTGGNWAIGTVFGDVLIKCLNKVW